MKHKQPFKASWFFGALNKLVQYAAMEGEGQAFTAVPCPELQLSLLSFYINSVGDDDTFQFNSRNGGILSLLQCLVFIDKCVSSSIGAT